MNANGLELAGRVAIITGASRGIGRAVVNRLAEMGVHVVVNYLGRKEAAEEVVGSAHEMGVGAIYVQGDVSNVKDADKVVAAAIAQFKRVDILVCNAGIWEGAPVESMPEEIWDRTIDTNLKGTWTLCRAAVPHMKQQGYGRIVIVSSTAGQRGEANYSNYAASKGGQISLTKALSTELGPYGITVNAVAPGWVDTDMSILLSVRGHRQCSNAIQKTRDARSSSHVMKLRCLVLQRLSLSTCSSA